MAACEHPNEKASMQSIRKEDLSEYSITVYPISMAGSIRKDVAEVIGLFMEKGGVQHIEIASQEIEANPELSIDKAGKQFSEIVKKSEFTTDHHLYAEYLGSPKEGVKEVRIYLCDDEGNLVWMNRQTPEERDFKKYNVKNPMSCCLLVAKRLQKKLNLKDPLRKNAPKGKMHQRWMEKSKIPSKKEQNAMKERLNALKNKADLQTLTVFPIRRGNQYDAKWTKVLAKIIEEQGLFKTDAVKEIKHFDIQGSSNEQAVLWDLARKVKTYLQEDYTPEHYCLITDYMIDKEEVHAVHFVLCDPQGEWVIVDYQNSHHRDFQKVDPKNVEDCHTLVIRRLEGYLD